MNAPIRKTLSDLNSELSEIMGQIEGIRDEEQSKFDGLPESLQSGEKGQAMEQAVSNLDEAVSSISDAMSSIEDASA